MSRLQVQTGVLLALLIAACDVDPQDNAVRYARSTYEKSLILAEGGDVDAQNLIGFMLFFGESVAENKHEAHFWFHRAAEQGHDLARMNLAILHGLGRDAELDREEAEHMYASFLAGNGGGAPPTLGGALAELRNEKPEATPPGRKNYETFCAGCHGLNGVARYVGSPSFAIGERMEKSDEKLHNSIAFGLGVMPDWESKLDRVEREQILAYVRTFEDRYRKGVTLVLRDAPAKYFTFGPMINEGLDKEEPGIVAPPTPQ
jgi:mono/diheme cytochrome c family protein